MQVLIVKDAATKVPREVSGMDEVEALRAQGWTVEVPEPAEAAPAEEQAAAPAPAASPAPAAKRAAAKKAAR